MENIIYNELRYRGFLVDVGIVPIRISMEDGTRRDHLEIDFIATLGSRKYYIQSALNMVSEQKEVQEEASLLKVDDSFKKIIIVKDVTNIRRDDNGISTMSIYDFLIKDNSLELL